MFNLHSMSAIFVHVTCCMICKHANGEVIVMKIFMSLVWLLEQTMRGSTLVNALDNNYVMDYQSFPLATSVAATSRPTSLQWATSYYYTFLGWKRWELARTALRAMIYVVPVSNWVVRNLGSCVSSLRTSKFIFLWEMYIWMLCDAFLNYLAVEDDYRRGYL